MRTYKKNHAASQFRCSVIRDPAFFKGRNSGATLYFDSHEHLSAKKKKENGGRESRQVHEWNPVAQPLVFTNDYGAVPKSEKQQRVKLSRCFRFEIGDV